MTIHDETSPDQHVDIDPSAEHLQPNASNSRCAPNVPAERAAGHASPVDHEGATDEPSTEKSLFPGDDLSSLRSRWDDVQAGFVDDPRACVQKADGLVSDVVEQLTSSFSVARARLEEQWARGEDASTEDLRLALKRYREFFQKLLAV